MSATKPLIVYINGYPGVGKLSVARALCSLLPKAKLFDNHSLIDATAMIFDREMPEYRPLRQQMRQLVLSAIAESTSTKDVTWIFTDSQSSSETDALVARDYSAAASERGSPFVSVILQCELEENIKRLTNSSRGGNNTKLTDVGILESIRNNAEIHRFGGEFELDIDTTFTSADVVAQEIKEFLDTV